MRSFTSIAFFALLAPALLGAPAFAQPSPAPAPPPGPAAAAPGAPPAASPPPPPVASPPGPPPVAMPPSPPLGPPQGAPLGPPLGPPPGQPGEPPAGPPPGWPPPPAFAHPPPLDVRGLQGGPPGARLERLRAVLSEVDAEVGDAHVPVLLASLAVGAAAIPSGAVMLSRDEKATTIGGAVLLGAGIGSVLGGVIQLFLPLGATMELGEELDSAAATGASPDVVVLTVEQQWAEVAADARLARKFGGAFGMGIGAIAVGAGTAVALAEPDGLSPTDQAILASGMVVAGSLSLVGGIQIFFTETPQEVAWNTYAASNGISKKPLVIAPRLSLAPTPGGGGVSFDGRF